MKTDVLIVGAGPVGLTMAAELVRYGLSVRIVDKNSQRTDKSKAIVIWSRTLELLDRMGPGVTDRFIQAGLKVEFTNIFAGGKQIAQVDLSTVDTPFKFVLLIQQNETERILEEYLAELGVKVERETELQDFEQRADSVSCNLVYADGATENAEFSWLIGCDGAHSTVRHRLGMTFEGSTLLNDWILADVHISGIDGPPSVNIHWHSAGILALFPLGGTRYRVIADVGASASDGIGVHGNPTLEEVQKILDVRGSKELRADDPVWLSSFTINERKVADYRKGRVFLAGDAAHVHSPAGGQGMNTGMHDAFNLAWKLALVSRGLCNAEPLLMSYSAERSAVAKLVLEATGRATKVALMRGEVEQSLRNHIASLIFGLAPVQHMMANVLSEVAIGYPDSPLNTSCGLEHSRPAPGERAPVHEQASAIGTGSTPRFALCAEVDDGAYKGIMGEFAGLLEPTLRPTSDSGCLWLVRPDGYVALRARSGDAGAVGAYLLGL
ncbi:FAD-dependent monooxygenase [Terriglobus sp. TAA 43]|uniref:FAD-dependent monooxygenase n=1 Tax=Terriglobus sp. TAA 43 TaxID=278961 RepID=UPI0006480133|nr:FAD-dependent monooxygenase [Terriglobus sp. TAA 43]